jgi:hypothetical protein
LAEPAIGGLKKNLKGALYTAVSQKVPGQNSKSEIL